MLILSKETLQFIAEHQHDDVRQLALRGCKSKEVDFRFALQQIEGRQKAKDKLPEYHANPGILYPPTLSMEQCSSSLTAQHKASLIHGESIADLSGGFGVDTSAFAKAFKQCYFAEPQEILCQLALHNLSILGHQNVSIYNKTMEDALLDIPQVDYIYVDPSRRDHHGHRVVTIEECTPNLLQWKEALLAKVNQGLMVKLSPMIDLKRTILQLPETSEIHIVAVNGECKEVIFILQKAKVNDLSVHTIDIRSRGDQTFSFSILEENEAAPVLASSCEHYLYEPNAAVMKAGAFKSIATRFGLKKLHPHTHLYTNSELVADFPGRIFRITDTFPFRKKMLANQLSKIKQANIAVRNFPLSTEELKKELKMKDGGEQYIFGATLTTSEKIIIIGQKAN